MNLGLFLDGFLCLDAEDGRILMLTRALEQTPVVLASDLYTFVTLLARISQVAHQRTSSDISDLTALTQEIDPLALSSSDKWEQLFEYLAN